MNNPQINITPIEDLTFLPAYKTKIKANGNKQYGLTGINQKQGVYFIKENDVLVYVGMSRSNLLKALYRHFQHWKSWNQRRVTYKNSLAQNVYTVACITTQKEAAHPHEKAYILMYNPRDNFDRYEEYVNQSTITVYEPQHDGIHVGEPFLDPAF